MAFHQTGVGKNLMGGSVRLQSAVVEYDDSLAVVQYEIQIVRGDDLGTGKFTQNL